MCIQIGDWQYETLALTDTGFEGAFVIPSTTLDLGLGRPAPSSNWILADGSIVETPVYISNLEVIGFLPISDIVITALGTDYVLGRRIIDRFEVTLDPGARIIVRP